MKKPRNWYDINEFYKFFRINDPDNISTVKDIAIMSKYLIKNYPIYYEMFKEKTFTWDRTGGDPIKQGNRNPLFIKMLELMVLRLVI